MGWTGRARACRGCEPVLGRAGQNERPARRPRARVRVPRRTRVGRGRSGEQEPEVRQRRGPAWGHARGNERAAWQSRAPHSSVSRARERVWRPGGPPGASAPCDAEPKPKPPKSHSRRAAPDAPCAQRAEHARARTVPAGNSFRVQQLSTRDAYGSGALPRWAAARPLRCAGGGKQHRGAVLVPDRGATPRARAARRARAKLRVCVAQRGAAAQAPATSCVPFEKQRVSFKHERGSYSKAGLVPYKRQREVDLPHSEGTRGHSKREEVPLKMPGTGQVPCRIKK